jgi:phi13 family phage major tail protein
MLSRRKHLGIQIGLKDLHVALLIKDDGEGVEYNPPLKLSKVMGAKMSVKRNTETLYADDGPVETISVLGEIEVEIELANLSVKEQALLLGHNVENGVLIRNAKDHAPYVAMGFRSLKSTGKYKYVWLYKGKFEIPDEEYQTKEDKPKFQTAKMKATFIRREFDDNW